jgi:hypothetical protein
MASKDEQPVSTSLRKAISNTRALAKLREDATEAQTHIVKTNDVPALYKPVDKLYHVIYEDGKEDGVTILDYSERSYAYFSPKGTPQEIDELKNAGGFYNNSLEIKPGVKRPGWVFGKSKKTSVAFLSKIAGFDIATKALKASDIAKIKEESSFKEVTLKAPGDCADMFVAMLLTLERVAKDHDKTIGDGKKRVLYGTDKILEQAAKLEDEGWKMVHNIVRTDRYLIYLEKL